MLSKLPDFDGWSQTETSLQPSVQARPRGAFSRGTGTQVSTRLSCDPDGKLGANVVY